MAIHHPICLIDRHYSLAIAQPSLRWLRLLMRKSFCYCYCEPQAPFPGRGCGGWDRYGRLVAGNFQTKKAKRSAVRTTINTSHCVSEKIGLPWRISINDRMPQSNAASAALASKATGKKRKTPRQSIFFSLFFRITREKIKKSNKNP